MINNYFDSASSSITKFFAKDFYIPGNPNSPTAIGRKANEALEEARQRIKDCLGVKSGKIIIGGTTSQLATRLMEQIDNIEPYRWLFKSFYEHECLDYHFPDFSINQLTDFGENLAKVRKMHPRVSIFAIYMLTNNITGTRFPVEKIGEICHKYDAYYIMDCTASIGHENLPDNIEDFCDCVLASSHKFHGEIGTGFMWVSDRLAKFLNLNEDSHNEYGFIMGTPNVSGIVAMSYAMESTINWQKKYGEKHFTKLFNYLDQKLEENRILRWYVDGKNDNCTKAINAIVFPEINADALVQYLSSKGIYISAGHSACTNDDPNASRVLEAFGLTKEEAEHTVRISFSRDNTFEEVDNLVNAIIDFKNKFC